MAIIVAPTPNMTFKRWANSLYTDMDFYEIPPIVDESEWWNWAADIVLVNRIEYAVPLPDKNLYKEVEDWRRWARQFYDGVLNLKRK